MQFSIITVTLNAGAVIERTLQSIAMQRNTSYELIIIDGVSTDDTLKVCQQYDKIVSKVIVEQDNGIYDAMNKGIDHAQGEYCLFLNAGDELYSKDTLSLVAAHFVEDTVLVSGDFISTSIRGRQKYIQTNKLSLAHLSTNFNACHQSIYIKRSHLARFDLQYRFLADYDSVIRTLKSCGDNQSVYVSGPLCRYYRGGYSDTASFSREVERHRILKHHFGWKGVIFSAPHNATRLLRAVLR